jgi:hypothetical protein
LISSTTAAGRTYTLQNSVTYTVNSRLKIVNYTPFVTLSDTITSNDASLRANFIYNGTDANSGVLFINSTRIDSSGGNPIVFLNGTSTDCLNWTTGKGGAFTFLN